MPNEYLLDTNIVVDLFQDNLQVRSRMALHRPTLLPFVTAAELLYGARCSRHPEETRTECELFLTSYRILYPNLETLAVYSDVRFALRKIGKPIPENDLWQAAIAIQHEAILVTNDAHFSVVAGLRTENWTV